MKSARFSPWLRASVLAASLLLLPMTTPTFAQTPAPTPERTRVETRVEPDRTGLWGLLGLVGLLGLTGLRRRPETVGVYTDTRPHSKV
jgi:MYXO-CTERM domain-containing protein